ncbi:MAG: hypothetical protein Q8P40_14675 [Nitrospirota bacterium]|nr:hypothetical protein [Nitrospirota bacterium]
MEKGKNQSKAIKLVNWLTDKSIAGIHPLSSAEDLATEYLIDQSYPDDEERIESLINWETTKNFTTGFITGLGGLINLPIAIPGAFAASWFIQARMAAAIAKIAGHDIYSNRVKTFVVASLAGDSLKDIVKSSGIHIGRGLSKSLISKIPGRVLIGINKKVGFRLITKAGEKGAINLIKGVPLVGGVVCGAFDATACRIVGKNAKRLFYKPPQKSKIVTRRKKVKP